MQTAISVSSGRSFVRTGSRCRSNGLVRHCSLRSSFPIQRTTQAQAQAQTQAQLQAQTQTQTITNITTNHWARRFSSGGGAGRRFSSSSSSSSSSSQGRFSFRTWFDWYSRKLDTHPVSTKCVSAGLISALGNVLAQRIAHEQQKQQQQQQQEQEEPNKPPNSNNNNNNDPFEVNLAQVGRFAFLNAAFVAPVLHHWYQFINRAVPGRSMARVMQRTFWDEFVFSPVYIPAFLGMLWKLEGAASDRIPELIRSECPSIIVAEWAMWVPTMIVTFRFVPVKFQVLVINVVGVVWQTYLAYAANNAHSSSVEKEEEHNNNNNSNSNKNKNKNKNNTDEETETSTTAALFEPANAAMATSILSDEQKVPLVLDTIVRQGDTEH